METRSKADGDRDQRLLRGLHRRLSVVHDKAEAVRLPINNVPKRDGDEEHVGEAKLKVTKHFGTYTAEGYIAHKPHYLLHLPVKIETDSFGSPVLGANGFPAPLRKNDRLVYCLPGGGEMIE